MKKSIVAVFLLGVVAYLGVPDTAVGQERSQMYNPNSVNPIAEYEQMFRKRIWRRMDLNEKMNRPFFSANNEITKIVIEAVKAGVLYPYKNDSLTTRMSKEEFLKNLEIPDYGGDDSGLPGGGNDWGGGGSDWGGGGSDWGGNGSSQGGDDAALEGPFEFFPKDVSILEVQEDMVFDKRRGRVYWDIQSITLVIPPEKFPETGLEKVVGTFRYKDLEALFRSMPDEAIWFNRQNSAEHKNMADAFALRLFDGRIIKYANPEDQAISEIYGSSQKQSIMASQWVEDQLIEYEHDLWEY